MLPRFCEFHCTPRSRRSLFSAAACWRLFCQCRSFAVALWFGLVGLGPASAHSPQVASVSPQLSLLATTAGELVEVSAVQSPVLFNPLAAIPLERRPPGLFLSTGAMNGWAFHDDWKAKGIPGELRVELLRLLVVTQSPSIVSGAGALRAQALSKRTSGIFYLTDRESAVRFLRESGLRALESEGWLPAGAFSPNAPALHIVIDGPPSPLFSDHGTDDTLEQDGNLKASFYWSSMSRAQSVEMGTFYYDPTPSLSSHQNAVRRLVEVAGNAGIARLVVPLPL